MEKHVLENFLDEMFNKLNETGHKYYLYKTAEEKDEKQRYAEFKEALDRVKTIASIPLKTENKIWWPGPGKGQGSCKILQTYVLDIAKEIRFEVCYNVEKYLADGGEHPWANFQEKKYHWVV